VEAIHGVPESKRLLMLFVARRSMILVERELSWRKVETQRIPDTDKAQGVPLYTLIGVGSQ
jgi:hypothetical protein